MPSKDPTSHSTGDTHPAIGLAAPAADVLPIEGGYRPIRQHAKGGLGEVLYAEDESLGRPVALKRLFGNRAADPITQQRFLREAAITAKLQHPGIVPVYGLTHDEQGRPAYAMRFIEGESLQEAIDGFHKTHMLQHVGLEFRRLLERFVTVCQTIAYAHNQGVVHRDIKPANIMLGPYGETLVVDWGLAKSLGSEQLAAGSEEPALINANTQADVTQNGLTMGTPAYMSPEQAEGRWDQVGPASDIYSLGATLYCLLTGKPAFGGGALDVLSAVGAGRWQPARIQNSNVPPGLDAICRKAMALDPGNRYATVEELSADLTRWLADEPVSCYREPFTIRARRWMRRHRALTTAAAALVITALAGLGIGLIAVNKERLRTSLERDEARKQKERTRAALDAMTSGLSERWLRSERQLRPEQTEFLEQALEYYQQFAAEEGNTEEARKSVAAAQQRVATLLNNLDRANEAEAGYRRAIESWKQLMADYPTNGNYDRSLAESHSNLGNLLRDLGRNTEAEPMLRQAVDAYKKMSRIDNLPPRVRCEWAWSLNNLAVLLKATNRAAEAEPLYQQAALLQEALLKDSAANEEYRADLAHTCNNLGNVLKTLNRPSEAEAPYRRGIQLYEGLVKDFPAIPDYNLHLARCWGNLAVLYATSGFKENAAAAYRKAIDTLEPVTRAYPSATKYRVTLALSYANFSQMFARENDHVQTLEWLNRADQLLRSILLNEPRLAEAKTYLRVVTSGRAEALEQLNRWEDVVIALDKAIELDDGNTGSNIRIQRAKALARSRDFSRSWSEIQLLSNDVKLTNEQRYNLCCASARLFEASKNNAHAELAVKLLKEANPTKTKVEADDDLSSLRQRPDYREWLKSLEPPK